MCMHGRFVALSIIYFLCPFIPAENGFNIPGLDPNKFGAAKLTITNMMLFKGPKRINCSSTVPELETKDGDFNKVNITIQFAEKVAFDSAKVSIWMEKNITSGSPDIVKLISRPCSHFFFSSILNQIFRATTSNCVAKKGVYKVNLNIQALTLQLFGLQFFYGTYQSKTCLLGKKCNIICVTTYFKMEPKDAMTT